MIYTGGIFLPLFCDLQNDFMITDDPQQIHLETFQNIEDCSLAVIAFQ